IEPFVVAAVNSGDTTDFGFGDPTSGTLYTFAFECSGTPAPTALAGTVLSYGIFNRYDAANATLDESQQLYRAAAGRPSPSPIPTPTGSAVPLACSGIGDANEVIWASTSPNLCTSAAPIGVTVALCGLYSRFDNANPPAACTNNVTDFTDLSTAYRPDTDIT